MIFEELRLEFLDKIPDTYITSFGKDNGRYENEDSSTHENNDFHVIPENQLDGFNTPNSGEHLNSSSNNEIYDKKK